MHGGLEVHAALRHSETASRVMQLQASGRDDGMHALFFGTIEPVAFHHDHLECRGADSPEDKIFGVSECIIMGKPMPIGTGLFKIHNNPRNEPMKDVPMNRPVFRSFNVFST